MKLSSNHHEVTLNNQIKWTRLIGILLNVTINTPLVNWIKEYLKDVKLIRKKKQLKGTKKDVKDEQLAP
jgi:hypothetical protein